MSLETAATFLCCFCSDPEFEEELLDVNFGKDDEAVVVDPRLTPLPLNA